MYNIAKNLPDRRGSNSVKWDGMTKMFGREDLLPLWVADMDFPLAPCIKEALQQKLDHGIFGYPLADEGYHKSFINWQRDNFDCDIKREWIRYAPGIVPALYWWINLLTEPNDACMVLTPVYYVFMDAIKDVGRKVADCPLTNDNNRYGIDFEAFERCIIHNKVKVFLLCSPHNPVGRVWTHSELKTMMDICQKHGVYVLSDEIHQDIVLGEKKHINTANVGDYADVLITMTSASKTFNLAGLRNSFIIIQSEKLRDKWDAFTKSLRMPHGNILGYIATQAAYTHGKPWLEELKQTIRDNDKFVRERLSTSLPEVEFTPLEATYLSWIDLKAYLKPEQIEPVMRDKCKLAIDFGKWFFYNKQDTHIRINLATGEEILAQAVDRITLELTQK